MVEQPAATAARRAWPTVKAILAATVFAASATGANWLTSRYGFIPVGLGLSATAGTYAAGLCLLARDWVHGTTPPDASRSSPPSPPAASPAP